MLFSGQVHRRADSPAPRSGRSTAPATRRSTSTCRSTKCEQRFGAAGDFAQAYVIAHEIGHHVQNLLGISGRSTRARPRERARANELSVRLELQADFLAGVWAHHAQRRFDILEPGDIEEALNAANAIGDDNLQREAQGRVVPDSFTHGTSEQRVRWFRLGFETGRRLPGGHVRGGPAVRCVRVVAAAGLLALLVACGDGGTVEAGWSRAGRLPHARRRRKAAAGRRPRQGDILLAMPPSPNTRTTPAPSSAWAP